METAKKTSNIERLRQLSYSELKKLALKKGIKKNLKAHKIIAALASMDSDDMDSFFTPGQQMINSSRKNKEEKFDEDMMTPLATPRRGTYSIGSPISLEVEGDISCVDVSNVTMERGSVKILRSRKVSFVTPDVTPRMPKRSNLRLRPKTPIASRDGNTSLVDEDVQEEKPADVSLHVTPKPDDKNISLEKSVPFESETSELKRDVTPGRKKSITFKNETSAKKNQAILTPKPTRTAILREKLSAKKNEVVSESSKKKRIATPNFKKIHDREFQKMESIDDYQKRKNMNSAKKIARVDTKGKVTKAKTKIPQFGGIPFIPSQPRTMQPKPKNNENVERKQKQRKEEVPKEVLTRNKTRFNLEASLARKLNYKPYSGPLKPLTPSNIPNTSSDTNKPVNHLVNTKRIQNRVALKGVRTNKRFELQMKNRNLQ